MKPLHKVDPRKSRKVSDAGSVSRIPRASASSKWSDDIDEILQLDPPEGWVIPIPNGITAERFRRSVRDMITKYISDNSPYTYRVTLTMDREVLVSCKN